MSDIRMYMETFRYWLTFALDILAVIGIGLALYRVIIMRRTFFSDHDRSRRTKAVDLIQFWSSKLTKQSSIARKLVESFSEEQCKSLAQQKEFQIDINKKDLIKEIITDIVIDGNQTSIKLNEAQSSLLRWEVVNYLNQLESVLAAWRHHVADREIIEEEFKYLYDPRQNHTGVEKFRKAFGTESYLGIKEFIEHVTRTEEKKNKKKGKKILGVW
jgi:hypothetical protein